MVENKDTMDKVTLTWGTANWQDDDDGGYLEWVPQSQEYNETEVYVVIELLRFECCHRNIKVEY